MSPEGESNGEGKRAHARTDEQHFLQAWRVIAIATCVGLIVFSVVIDSLGRLIFRPDFHVSEILFGGLLTTLLVLLGFEVRSLRRNGNGNGDKP